jgi:lipopolysaccharide export system ATP-binding protein
MAILELRPLTKSQRRARAEELMAQFGLAKLRNQQARTLSGGERRKLEIARALVTEPSLILLDEPFSGVDPIAVEDLQVEIKRLRQQQRIAMLVTDHNVQRTLEIVDRAYVIFNGKVCAEGTPREIVNNPEVRRQYLGSTFKGDEFD